MQGIKKFIECHVPVTACNLMCSYCYVIDQNRRDCRPAEMRYSVDRMGRALSVKRWGGICFVSMTAPGETLLAREVVDLAGQVINQGHYVNITTNGTLSERFEEITAIKRECLQRLHLSFSLHYLELKKRSLVETFFNNVDMCRKAGCSVVVQMNFCDEYVPYLEEIKTVCRQRTGALPQLAVTRRQCGAGIGLRTDMSAIQVARYSGEFDSPLYDYGIKNFLVKRKEFCYAGAWSFKLYLETGLLKSCYDSGYAQYIFDNIESPIKFRAVGNNCESTYCVNSTHFMALGVIPEMKAPSYAALRNRPEARWYNPGMLKFLNSKLYESNREYGRFKMFLSNIRYLASIKVIGVMSRKIARIRKFLE